MKEEEEGGSGADLGRKGSSDSRVVEMLFGYRTCPRSCPL